MDWSEIEVDGKESEQRYIFEKDFFFKEKQQQPQNDSFNIGCSLR